MIRLANFAAAKEYLERYYRNSRTPYTLDSMRMLMHDLGDPQDSLRIVHVAGTSGKTSTAYYAAALLTAAGHKTGLTVSPHVDEINERVQINMQPAGEAEFCRTLAEFLDIVEASPVRPSWFEAMVAYAYWYFARQGVDYAVVEVGLGGLLDGTNVVSRPDKLCIITDIGLDHTKILGDSLTAIASQKAGIIQPNNVVFMYQQSPEVMAAVRRQIQDIGASLHVLPDGHAVTSAYVSDDLPPFQQRNFGLALAAVTALLGRDGTDAKYELSPAAAANAAATYIPGRMETIRAAGKTIIFDGAHNAQKLSALLSAVASRYPGNEIAALVAFVSGDDTRWQQALDVVLPRVARLIVTSFDGDQDMPRPAIPPHIIADYCRQHGFHEVQTMDVPQAAVTHLLASKQPLLLICGSFFLISSIRPLLPSKGITAG